MRGISRELERRLKLLQQTAYNNADPRAVVRVSRPTSALTDGRYLDKTLVGTFPGLSASSIATRRMRLGGDVDRVYIGFVADGVAQVRWAKASPDMSKHIWNDGGFSAEALDIAIAFDGTMPKKAKGSEFITEERPWVFWVTPEGELKGRILGLLGDVTLAASHCTKVTAIRATWSSAGGVDFGLVVFFLLSGDLYYRQLINGVWEDAVPVSFVEKSWTDIAAFRTWDYRIGVQCLSSSGEVYEVFTQYQGFGKHGTEHIRIAGMSAETDFVEVEYQQAKETEHLKLASASAGALYGGLYAIGTPSIVNAYNVEDTNEDWGKIAVFVFDKHLVAAEVAAQYSSFSIVDDRGRTYAATSATLSTDGKTVTLTFLDFNNASGICQAKYTPGTVTTMAGATLTATSYAFTPQNLVPTSLPVPEPLYAENVGITDIGYCRVRFYETDGLTLLATEWVKEGDDCEYGTDEVWAITANSGVIAVDITEDVQSSIDLYKARWKVSYWNKAGTSVLYEELVVDGDDAVWGDDQDWSNAAEGEAVSGILEDVSSNINVYAVESYTAIEWIQSSGTQWIDTLFTANQNTSIEIDYIPTALSGDKAIFGSRVSGSSRDFELHFYSTTNVYPGYGSNTDIKSKWGAVAANVRVLYKHDKTSVYKDGALIHTFNPATFTTPYDLVLFGIRNNNTNPTWLTSMRLYSCKLWDNGMLVRDFRPALDGNNVACLYDAVSSMFFYNAGTGGFGYPYIPSQAEAQLKADMAITDYCRLSYALGDGASFNGRYFRRTTSAPPVVFMNYINTTGYSSYGVISKVDTIPPSTSNSNGNLIYSGTIDINGHTLHLFTMYGKWQQSPATVTYTVDGASVTFPNNTVLVKVLASSKFKLDGDAQAVAEATALLERFATM